MVKGLGFMETIIRIVCIITLFVMMPLKIVAAKCGWNYPEIFNSAVVVLMSAAVGYVTNWIAIEMLFKPYEKNAWHPFSIFTFGYWQQGLVPRNKDMIGVEMGKETERRLLNPEMIAKELCSLIPSMLSDRELTGRLIGGVKNLIIRYRDPIARKVVEGFQRRSPQVMELAKNELGAMVRNFCNRKFVLSAFADELSETLVDCIDWRGVEQRLKFKLAEQSTLEMVGSELDSLIEPCVAWVERDLVPMIEPQLLELANGPLKDKIVEKLDLANRVAEAVRRQDVREFHGMINSLAAKHLGAIQILGYFLGGLVGFIQLAG